MRIISNKSESRTGYLFFHEEMPWIESKLVVRDPLTKTQDWAGKSKTVGRGRSRHTRRTKNIREISDWTAPGPEKMAVLGSLLVLYYRNALSGPITEMIFFYFSEILARIFFDEFLKWFLVFFQEKWRLFEVSFPRCHFRKCENPSERKFFGNFENYFA